MKLTLVSQDQLTGVGISGSRNSLFVFLKLPLCFDPLEFMWPDRMRLTLASSVDIDQQRVQ
jgi:hypothetical protein